MQAMDKVKGMGRNGPWPGGGLADPSDFAAAVAPRGDEAVRRIMSENGHRLIAAP